MWIEAPISLGDLVDRITILEIKLDHLPEGDRRNALEREREALEGILEGALGETGIVSLLPIRRRLETINADLWALEDDLRKCERSKTFGDAFVQMARRVYRINDERAAVKREINETFGSDLGEEKLYPPY